MTDDEHAAKLADFERRIKEAFADGSPDIKATQQIISELLMIPDKERPMFRDVAISVANKLFKTGASLPGLDLTLFSGASNGDGVSGTPSEGSIEDEVDQTTHDDVAEGWFEVFRRMHECLLEDIETLKGYFFIRLQNDSSGNYVPLLLFDESCHHRPVKRRLKKEFQDCEVETIESLRERVESNYSQPKNYVAILLLPTRINDEEGFDGTLDKLSSIIDRFDSFEALSICPSKGALTKKDLVRTADLDTFKEELRYSTTILLSNAEISFEEEKIIKRLFQHLGCPVLEYKVIKKGKSGARVLEVRPQIGDQSKRYIAKFEPANRAKRKIWDEYNRLGQYIEIYSINGYQPARHSRSAAVECLQLTYASNDAISPSFSFAQIISKEKGTEEFDAEDTLDRLFQQPAFQHWDTRTLDRSTAQIESFYSDYIVSSKLKETLMKIKGLTESEVENDKFFQRFEAIAGTPIELTEKVCHGDLHSENFFRDAEGVYLIDFGFTGTRHALIDHAMLECSIKFKHIPQYIAQDILMDIEKQLSTDDAFTSSFSVTCGRSDILQFYELLKPIRLNAKRLYANPESPLEYLISLLMITCRLMDYEDLNQLYALNSADILATRIEELLVLKPN